jgi:hypothetical protein
MDMEIITTCLVNDSNEKVKMFTEYTVQKKMITKNINGFGVVVILCLLD